jgi:hypothetical protein
MAVLHKFTNMSLSYVLPQGFPPGRSGDAPRIGWCSGAHTTLNYTAETSGSFNKCYELYFVLSSTFIGVQTDGKNMHSMSNIKKGKISLLKENGAFSNL